MEKNWDYQPGPSMSKISTDKLQLFLADHLNKIYCAKAHLAERLPEIADQANFEDLKQTIVETTRQIEHQVAEFDKIFDLIGLRYSFEKCTALISLLENAYALIHQESKSSDMRDLYILSYMHLVESVETSSLQVLKIIASITINAEIKTILNSILESSTADRALLILIREKYIEV